MREWVLKHIIAIAIGVVIGIIIGNLLALLFKEIIAYQPGDDQDCLFISQSDINSIVQSEENSSS